MSQTRPLIDTLKQKLRKQWISYQHVSEALEFSVNGVKRLFAALLRVPDAQVPGQ